MDVNLDNPIKTGFYDEKAFAEYLSALHFWCEHLAAE